MTHAGIIFDNDDDSRPLWRAVPVVTTFVVYFTLKFILESLLSSIQRFSQNITLTGVEIKVWNLSCHSGLVGLASQLARLRGIATV
jgi:hypothetical protein